MATRNFMLSHRQKIAARVPGNRQTAIWDWGVFGNTSSRSFGIFALLGILHFSVYTFPTLTDASY